MPAYVQVAVNIPQVQGVFDYHVPSDLTEKITPGQLVVVPFGRQSVQGVILKWIAAPSVSETRPVREIVDPQAVLTAPQLALAEWLSQQYQAPLSACIDLMLPPGLAQQADTLYQLRGGVALGEQAGAPTTSSTQEQLISLLGKRGPLRGGQIDHALPHTRWRPAMQVLVKRGLVRGESILPPPKIRPKMIRTAQLAVAPATAEQAMASLGKAGSSALARRQAILRYLIAEAGPVEVAWLYAESDGNLADLHALADRDLIQFGESETWRDPLQQLDFQPHQAPLLTQEQQAAWDAIHSESQLAGQGRALRPVLLHGVTGSGKTELYLKAVQETLLAGRQAIILVPEIALTPQTVRRFASRFPGQVGLFHSRLSTGERYDTWRRARSGNLPVIVGPRSALFAPLPQPGLIVIDECHDDSYYQTENLPYYHAGETARAYARLTGALCLLGSATPSVSDTYQASQKKYLYVHLPARILAHREAIRLQISRARLTSSQYRRLEGEAETIELPPVQLVDMRQELQAGNRSMFSRPLQAALAETLEQRQQAILFLNRRGTATYVFCRNCGYSLKCPACDLPLTYHTENLSDSLHCHYCGYQRKLPRTCPQCSSDQIRKYGAGTERVEAELVKLFPQARPIRWDFETTRQKGAHDLILGHFAAQRADILIGTQMIAKGLDFPLVTLVGVILADVGLNLPDYRAGERTFQLLTQVAGRAGRSPLGGQVILQTFQPDHYVIQAASRHSYREFYQRELEYRRQLGYPPFASLVRLEYRHRDPSQAEQAAHRLADQIQAWMAEANDSTTEMIGPAPCFFGQRAGQHRWQIILRGPGPAILLSGRILEGWKIEVNPPNLL